MRRIVYLLLIVAFGGMAVGQTAASDFEAGLAAAKAENYTLALDKFEQALKADPNSLECGNAYRQAAVKVNTAETYDRCIGFLEQLVADHPKAPNAWLNYGYAHVDKIPVEGAITQVLLANTALGYFSSALELEETWLGHYTRGNSYLYWPAIFGRTPLAIADLEKAVALSRKVKQRSYHARAYVGLGEAHWRLDDLAKAREVWKEALALFPDNEDLKVRMEKDDEELGVFLTAHFEPGQRVDTNLSIIWEESD